MLWPSQHCHAKRAGPFPCFKNTELQRSDSATQLCHPSCRHYSHLLQWKRTRATLDHAVHKGNENSLSIAKKDFLHPKSEVWFSLPWSAYLQTYFLGHKITEFQLQCLPLSCSEKWNQMLANRRDQICTVAPVHQVCQTCTFSSIILPPAAICIQAWKYWGQHFMPEDETGCRWPGFPQHSWFFTVQ